MTKSEVLEQLAEFITKLQHQKLTKDQVNLALANWVLDTGIIIVAPDKEAGDVDVSIQ